MIFLFIFLLMILLFLNNVLSPYLVIYGAAINFYLIFLVYLNSYFKKWKIVWYFGFFAGVLYDIFSGYPFGVYSITLFLSAIFLNFLSENIFIKKRFYPLLSELILTNVFYEAFFIILLNLFSSPQNYQLNNKILLLFSLFNILYTAAVFILTWYLKYIRRSRNL